MTGAQFGSFILGLVVVAIVVAIAVWLLHWLYLRSSKERSQPQAGVASRCCFISSSMSTSGSTTAPLRSHTIRG